MNRAITETHSNRCAPRGHLLYLLLSVYRSVKMDSGFRRALLLADTRSRRLYFNKIGIRIVRRQRLVPLPRLARIET